MTVTRGNGMSSEYQYRLNCGQYVLHNGEAPIGPVMDEVAIGFDKESGTLHKHGSLATVEKWLKNAQAKFRAAGFDDMANELTMVSGRFELDDLNRCLSTTGYIGRLYEKLQRGEVRALGFGSDSSLI